MSVSDTISPDLNALQADLAALKRDVSGLMEHLKLGATNGARSAAAQLDDGARQFYNDVAAKGDLSAKAISRQIEEQPLVALMIALGVGYIGGRVLSR